MKYEHERHRFRGSVMGRQITVEFLGVTLTYETGRKFAGEYGARRFRVGAS